MNWQPKQSAFRALLKAFLAETSPLYVVGGAVRDFLLGRGDKKTDIDLVVERSAAPVAQRVANRLGWAFYPLDADRDVARLIFAVNNGPPLVCDVASLRGGSLEVDLRARDFTVNAMAFVLANQEHIQLIDLYGGQEDLARRLVRRVTASTFAEDPVRMLRAVRFTAQLGFTLEEETLIQIKRMSTTVKLASAERIRDELWKTLTTATPAKAIEDLRTLGLLAHVLPEVYQMVDVPNLAAMPQNKMSAWSGGDQHASSDLYQHTLHTVEHAAQLRAWLKGNSAQDASNMVQEVRKGFVDGPDSGEAALKQVLNPWYARLRQHFADPVSIGRPRYDWLIWHALFHVESPNAAAQRLTSLHFSRQEITLASTVIQGCANLHTLHAKLAGQALSRRDCYRFFREIGGKQWTTGNQLAGIDAIFLTLADFCARTALRPDASSAWLDFLAHAEQLLAFAFTDTGVSHLQASPLVDGRDLMENLDLSPGRQVGELLEELSEAQVAGEIQTTGEALDWASRWLNEQVTWINVPSDNQKARS